MNVVILGILSKTALLMLVISGLWLAVIQPLQGRSRRWILPPAVLTLLGLPSPMRANTCRLINLPSRAPPGDHKQAIIGNNVCRVMLTRQRN